MKHSREENLSLSLSLSIDPNESPKKMRRKPAAAATSGDGEFICKTCRRAFPSFQALGGHRTSHIRGGRLDLGLGFAMDKPRNERSRHECHVCGLRFEMGQALGGHMRRHRDALEATGGAGDSVQPGQLGLEPPVLLELFV